MGSQQLYSLSWGEFGTSLSSTVQVLRGHGEMVDVTLAAGGRIFPAHKLVLSAASPLLMELLKSTHCHHPVVMLAGITAPDLEALLQFVYQGEVSVETTQLPSLLQAAHCLNIQALSPQTLTTEKTMAQISVPVMMGDMPQQTIPMNSQLPPMTREMHVSQPAMARESHSVALPSMPREMTTSSLPSLSRDITTQIASISREMNPAVMPQLSTEVNSPLLPVRKRKRKQRNNSETDSVKWGVTEGEGVGVGGVMVETSRSMEVVDSSMVVTSVEELKEEVMDETHCNGEPSSAKKLVSDLPVECTICGVTLRQSRNLRRHMELIHLKIDNSGKQRKLSSKDEGKKEEEVTVHAGGVEAEQEAGPSRLAPPPGPSSAQLYHTSTQCDPYQLQPPTMFAADSVFRQQQTELLRGAGLYADTREHCPSVTQ